MSLQESIITGFADLKSFISTKLSPDSELSSAKNALGAAQQSVVRAEERIAALEKELADAKAAAEKAQADLKATNEAVEAHLAEIKKLRDEAKTVEQLAGERAQAITAGQGIPANKLPAATETGKKPRAELLKEFASITDHKVRAAFYAEHKDTLLGK